MMPFLLKPFVLTFLAVGLTVAAVLGKSTVVRIALGVIAYLLGSFAFFEWQAFRILKSAKAPSAEEAVYVGWDLRFVLSWPGLLWIVLFAGYMAFVLWAGRRH